MASEVRGVFVSLALFNAFILITCASEFAPVLLWQSSSLGGDLPSVSALDKLSLHEFTGDLTGKLNRRGPVLFFLQDDLSLEDFTLWGNIYDNQHQKNSFTNIQKLLDNNPSALFPAVESPSDSISVLADGRKVVEVTGNQVLSLSSEDLDNTFLVYRLPSTETEERRQQALSQNDQIIGEAINKISAKSPSYTAIYTAEHSSWVSANKENPRSLRHILETTDSGSSTNGTFYGDNCTALYYDTLGFVLYQRKSSTDDYVSRTFDLTAGSLQYVSNCEDIDSQTTLWFMLTYSDNTNPNITDMTLYMEFGKAIVNDWNITAMNLTYKLKDHSESVQQGLELDSNLWAPMTFSYHCGQQTFRNDSYNYFALTEEAGVTFTNLQIQMFQFNQRYTFGDPFDCVGFFTIGIWMSIFITGILVIILGFGIHMTISIETMDRFDDPKGKTITITTID